MLSGCWSGGVPCETSGIFYCIKFEGQIEFLTGSEAEGSRDVQCCKVDAFIYRIRMLKQLRCAPHTRQSYKPHLADRPGKVPHDG